jgi:hypothetical protein
VTALKEEGQADRLGPLTYAVGAAYRQDPGAYCHVYLYCFLPGTVLHIISQCPHINVLWQDRQGRACIKVATRLIRDDKPPVI